MGTMNHPMQTCTSGDVVDDDIGDRDADASSADVVFPHSGHWSHPIGCTLFRVPAGWHLLFYIYFFLLPTAAAATATAAIQPVSLCLMHFMHHCLRIGLRLLLASHPRLLLPSSTPSSVYGLQQCPDLAPCMLACPPSRCRCRTVAAAPVAGAAVAATADVEGGGGGGGGVVAVVVHGGDADVCLVGWVVGRMVVEYRREGGRGLLLGGEEREEGERRG